MSQRAHGFSLTDHRRVSRLVRKDEQGLFNPPKPTTQKPSPRGLVRVMLLSDLAWSDPNLPEPIKGDFPLDARKAKAVVTQPTSADFGGKVHYALRCVATDTILVARSWQLTVIAPDGTRTLTAPIDEHATGDQVKSAINATGCPPCAVAGAGAYLLDEDESQIAWPARQWHIFWDDPTWTLSTQRTFEAGGETQLEYVPGGDEVPIALTPTYFAPTPFAEDVYLPYLRPFATPTPGTFALCLPMHGLGLTIIDAECWNYVEG